MGGSGSGFSLPSKTLETLLEEEQKTEEYKVFSQELSSYLLSLLKDLNERDIKAISTHLETIKSILNKEIEGSLDLKFGGSISKNTYANGLSDIDMLVKINDSSLAKKSPKQVLKCFAEQIQSSLPRTKVDVGVLAVTVSFSDGHQIQLLPSIATETGFKIAQPNSKDWSSVIRPDKFAEKLTDINQKCGLKVVPAIKLFKAINAKMPKPEQLSGYHIESLAIETFKSYKGPFTPQGMLLHFTKGLINEVLSPIGDRTGQSLHVDDYLGEKNSDSRLRISKAFERLSNKIKNASLHKSLDKWKEFIDLD